MRLHVVGHEAPDDDPAACDDGCGRLEIEPGLDGSHALLEIDDAASAEIWAWLTGRGVEGDQTRVDRWNEDPARAIRCGRPLARHFGQLVVAETAAARPGGRFDPDVVAPAHCARICIERGETTVARAGVDVSPICSGVFCSMPGPSSPERKVQMCSSSSDILAVDLRERRIARARGGPPVRRPVGRLLRFLCRHERAGWRVLHYTVGHEREGEFDGDRERERAGNARRHPPRFVCGETQRGEQREECEAGRHQHAREERPIVETRFPKRPGERGSEERHGQQRARRPPSRKQHADGDVTDTTH